MFNQLRISFAVVLLWIYSFSFPLPQQSTAQRSHYLFWIVTSPPQFQNQQRHLCLSQFLITVLSSATRRRGRQCNNTETKNVQQQNSFQEESDKKHPKKSTDFSQEIKYLKLSTPWSLSTHHQFRTCLEGFNVH